MIEFKMDDARHWIESNAITFRVLPSLTNYKIRIDGVIYNKVTQSFKEAFNKECMWEQLQK